MIINCLICKVSKVITDAWHGVALELWQGWLVEDDNYFCDNCKIMNILCKKCGLKIAERHGNTIKVNGTPVPSENVEGVILKCICGRTRTYYLNKQSVDGEKNNPSGVIFS